MSKRFMSDRLPPKGLNLLGGFMVTMTLVKRSPLGSVIVLSFCDIFFYLLFRRVN